MTQLEKLGSRCLPHKSSTIHLFVRVLSGLDCNSAKILLTRTYIYLHPSVWALKSRDQTKHPERARGRHCASPLPSPLNGAKILLISFPHGFPTAPPSPCSPLLLSCLHARGLMEVSTAAAQTLRSQETNSSPPCFVAHLQ